MSSTEMYRVDKNGNVVHHANFANSHRGAMLVWRQMGERYLSPSSFSPFNMQPVWDLAENSAIHESHRIVMLSTFDNAMVRQENLDRLLAAIEEYAQEFDAGNLVDQAEAIRDLRDDGDTLAVCWNQTSVNCNPWIAGDAPYNIDGTGKNAWGKRHWFLFDELENPTEASRE